MKPMLAQANVQHLPLADHSVNMIFTDPPYPHKYLHTYGWLGRKAARVLVPGGFVLAMCGGRYLNQIYRMFDESGLTYFYEMHYKTLGPAPIVYLDNRHTGGYPLLARSKTIIAYSAGPGRPRVGNLSNLFETLDGWSEAKKYHAWGQDVACARYFIDHFSRKGDLVCDPFIGGGTTLIASELIGRRCIGFDIDVTSVKVTRRRLHDTIIPIELNLFSLVAE